MRVGFLGVQCDNPNLGVSALAYGGFALVDALAPPAAEFVLFSPSSPAGIERMRTDLGIERAVSALPFRHKNPVRLLRSVLAIGACDFVVDFSGGDSFSDIYGAKRITKLLLHKEFVILTRTPLVLAPQTYGPFTRRIFKPWVRHVLRRAAFVFARDAASADFARSLVERDVVLTTDVAVRLPWEPPAVDRPGDGRLRVGFNVSGLLWAGGYTGANQFGLVTDYRAYCDAVVAELLEQGHDVELIAHVQSRGDAEGEDDLAACVELQALHPAARLGPRFVTPVEAKSHIAGADVFIGARMHATIAAFTSGVATIPVAYSRKFEGFYGSLGYPEVVDLKALSTAEAVARTLTAVAGHAALASAAAPARDEAQRRIELFSEGLRALVARV